MMKKERINHFTQKAIAVFLLVGAGFGTGVLLADEAKAQDTSSLLWKVEGTGLDKPSYVFGTIHLICPDDFFLSDAVKQAVAESDQVVMELDMDDPELMTKMQRLSMNPDMKNFSEKLSEEQLATINAFFTKHYGASLTQLGIMKPFTLLSMMLLKSMNCAQPASYEQSLVEVASENELEVYGLETVEFQMSIFDNASLEEQVSWLTYYAKDEEGMKNEFKSMVEMYKKQDLAGLHGLIAASPQFEGMADDLLYNRNADWIDKMKKFASVKSTFFAVGAGHLGSDKGVLALLRNEGYTITAVK